MIWTDILGAFVGAVVALWLLSAIILAVGLVSGAITL